MSEEQVIELLEEIAPEDDSDHRWIECSSSSGYTDDNQYERIVAALKQNIELQHVKDGLLEDLRQLKQSLEDTQFDKEQQIKMNKDIDDMYVKSLECIKKLILLLNASQPQAKPLERINDYEITYSTDGDVELTYKPLLVTKPVTLEIKLVTSEEHLNIHELCPICKKELGQYPAISRKDNNTKICSECGTIEALKAWEESLNDKKEAI